MKETVLIPEDRINIIKDRKVLNRLEKELNVKIKFFDNSVEIDSEGLELLKSKI